MSEVVRVGSIIILHLSKLWKAEFFTLSDVIFLVRLQGGNLKLITLRSERILETRGYYIYCHYFLKNVATK